MAPAMLGPNHDHRYLAKLLVVNKGTLKEKERPITMLYLNSMGEVITLHVPILLGHVFDDRRLGFGNTHRLLCLPLNSAHPLAKKVLALFAAGFGGGAALNRMSAGDGGKVGNRSDKGLAI